MRPLEDAGHAIEAQARSAATLLALAEEVLEHWLSAHGASPTNGTREGFRLLALHRQGARDDPSFNACRETCRELAYYYNLIASAPTDSAEDRRLEMMRFAAKHLYYFVSGKLEQAQLGDFCCASRPLRQATP